MELPYTASMDTSTLRPTDRAGFSLVELMIVLVVAGIMLAVAAPRMNGYANRVKVDGAADEIGAQVAYAQLLAVRQSRPVLVRLQQTGDAPGARYDYQIVEMDGTTEISRRAGSVNEAGDQLVLQVYEGGAAQLGAGGVYNVEFTPRGLVRGQVPESVVVTRDGQRATLSFTALGKTYREN